MHDRIKSVEHEWVIEAGNFQISLRVHTDLELNPAEEGFDRQLINEVFDAVRRAPTTHEGVVRRVTLVGVSR